MDINPTDSTNDVVNNFINFINLFNLNIYINVLAETVIFCDLIRNFNDSAENFGCAIKYNTFTLYMNHGGGFMTNLEPTMDNMLGIMFNISNNDWNIMMAAIEDKWKTKIEELTFGILTYV